MKYSGYFAFLVLFVSCNKSNTPSPSPAELGGLQVISAEMNRAVVVNTIISSGNSPVTAKGICWSATTSIPSIDSAPFTVNRENNLNTYTDTLTGLTYNTKYYLRSYATNELGTFYSVVDSFFTLPPKYSIGEFAEGGNVIYVDSTGEHGLIAASHIYVASFAWSFSYEYLGANETAIGTGASNTMKIINAGNNATNTAAVYCNNLVADGYDDWFLPSYEEMRLFRKNLSFSQWLNYPWERYWTSSEYYTYPDKAYFVVIGGGASFEDYDKMVALLVLPMRKY